MSLEIGGGLRSRAMQNLVASGICRSPRFLVRVEAFVVLPGGSLERILSLGVSWLELIPRGQRKKELCKRLPT